METFIHHTKIYLTYIFIFVVWIILILLFRHKFEINAENLFLLFDDVTLYGIASYLFVHRFWRYKIFRGWLVQLPNLEGTWEGIVETIPDGSANQKPRKIKAFLIIKQSFHSISCRLLTKESTSKSEAAVIIPDEESDQKYLNYIYLNTPNYHFRDKSPVHNGGAKLQIIMKPGKILNGSYWTDRKTRGQIEVKFISKELREKF